MWLSLVAVAGWTAAAPDALDLRWQGACDGADAVERRLRQEVDLDDPEGELVRVEADVRVRSRDTEVEAVAILTTLHGQTQRTLKAASCDELFEATALLIAMHIDPLGESPAPTAVGPVATTALPQDSPPEDPPSPGGPPADDASALEGTAASGRGEDAVGPAPVGPAPAGVAPPTPPRRSPDAATAPHPTTPSGDRAPPPVLPYRGHVRAEVGVVAGVLPRPGPAFALAGGVERRWLRIEAIATYLPPQQQALARALNPGAQASFQSWSIGARGCGVLSIRAVSIPLCGTADAGAMHGRARRLATSQSATRPQVAIGGGAAVRWELAARWSFWARAEAAGQALRPRFSVQGLGNIHQAEPWRFCGALGAELELW